MNINNATTCIAYNKKTCINGQNENNEENEMNDQNEIDSQTDDEIDDSDSSDEQNEELDGELEDFGSELSEEQYDYDSDSVSE